MFCFSHTDSFTQALSLYIIYVYCSQQSYSSCTELFARYSGAYYLQEKKIEKLRENSFQDP